jgi:hypothetical protein
VAECRCELCAVAPTVASLGGSYEAMRVEARQVRRRDSAVRHLRVVGSHSCSRLLSVSAPRRPVYVVLLPAVTYVARTPVIEREISSGRRAGSGNGLRPASTPRRPLER